MSKLFKTIGIGAAIGTLAYVVFKYKKDQKFKEKVDEKKDEVKQEVKKVGDKALDKACSFTVNHPKAALGIIAGTVVGGTVLGTAAAYRGVTKYKADRILAGAMKTYPLEGKELEEHEKWWNENGYGENFERTVEFAKTLNLHEHEALAITTYEEDGVDLLGVVQEYVDGKRFYTKKETYAKEN